jgi:hypothetical protein
VQARSPCDSGSIADDPTLFANQKIHNSLNPGALARTALEARRCGAGAGRPPVPPAFQHRAEPGALSRDRVRGLRYPTTNRASLLGASEGDLQAVLKSVKQGGDQFEYEDQDSRIHSLWLEDMRRNNAEPAHGEIHRDSADPQPRRHWSEFMGSRQGL